jgi:Stress responsive A/B Barrel Domain
MLRRLLILGALAAAIACGAFAQNKYAKPKSVLHIVTLYFKDNVTAEQKKAVYDGIEKMAAEVPGIKNIWLKTLKVQGRYEDRNPDGSLKKAYPYTDAFVIEFESQEAFDKYADHPAHKAWEALYVPLRGRSTTSDVSN